MTSPAGTSATPMVHSLLVLIRLNNEHRAFGIRVTLADSDGDTVVVHREHGEHWAELQMDCVAGGRTLRSS